MPASFQNLFRSLRSALSSVLLAAAAGTALAVPLTTSVSTNPVPSPAQVGDSVNVGVLVDNATDLYGYQFSLGFDPTVLQFSSATPGSFLGITGNFGVASFNNTTGLVSFVFDALTGAGPGPSGNGVLANVIFSAIGAGTSPLTFSNVILQDSNLDPIFTSSFDGSLTVQAVTPVPEPSTAILMALGIAALWMGRRSTTRA